MKLQHCAREAALLDAVRTDRCDEDLRAHAASCAACGEVLLVARLMNSHAREVASSAPLPDPGPIWWKAELQQRRDAAARAARPIVLAEKVAQIAGIAVGGVLLIWRWPLVQEWLSAVSALAEGARAMAPIFQANLLLIGSLALLPLILALSLLGTARASD